MTPEHFQKEYEEIRNVVKEKTKDIEHMYQWAELEKWYYSQMKELLNKAGLYKEDFK